jgi:hypothetical protein
VGIPHFGITPSVFDRANRLGPKKQRNRNRLGRLKTAKGGLFDFLIIEYQSIKSKTKNYFHQVGSGGLQSGRGIVLMKIRAYPLLEAVHAPPFLALQTHPIPR